MVCGEAVVTGVLLRRGGSDAAVEIGLLVGSYASWAGAFAARDWVVLRQLEPAGGHRVELGHVIVDATARAAVPGCSAPSAREFDQRRWATVQKTAAVTPLAAAR